MLNPVTFGKESPLYATPFDSISEVNCGSSPDPLPAHILSRAWSLGLAI